MLTKITAGPRKCSIFVPLAANSFDAPASADEGDSGHRRTADQDLGALTQLVRKHAPALQSDLLATDVARADARQAHLLLNPVLDATWGTIPIGETNPANLSTPLTNVPSYSVGVSYTFLLGKRGPRQARAEAIATGLAHSADASALGQAASLARILGHVAVDRLRLDGLRSLVEQQ